MFRSIRARIMLGHVAVWAAIILTSAAGVYLYVGHQLQEQQDRALASCLEVIGRSLTHEVEEHGQAWEGEEEFAMLLATLHHQSFPRQAISVFRGSRPVARKTGDSDISIGTLLQAGPGRVTFARRPLGRISARVAVSPLLIGSVRYTLVAAEPEADLDLALTSLRRALMLLVVFALALSILGGYFLAGRALQPVVDMAKAVDRIDVQDPAHQIEIPNPHDELGYLGATFNRLLVRLNAALEQQRKFMADASHELRTPLSVSLLAAQIALDRPRSEQEYRESLRTIREQLQRLSRLVLDMLTLARSDAGGFTLKKRRCDIGELVLEAVRAAQVLARDKKIRIEVNDVPEMPGNVDPELIHQMMVILLDNAIKYSPSSTTIHVNLRLAETGCELIVRDEGHGIPSDAQARIFDRFYRGEESRSRKEADGAGLGLPIARWIAQAHGGVLELAETGTHGSAFRVRLPGRVSVEEPVSV
jgi:heavy metal sensor kinase